MSAQTTSTTSTPESGADRAATFQAHRRRLWGIAYRMLGSRAEADDVVQDAYLRWHRVAPAEIQTPEAWLVTATTRLAIDRLRQLRAERERYVGPWLPEPLVDEPSPAADHALELADDLSVALLAVLERLAPAERAAFLLHDVFDMAYPEIAQCLGKSETTCRQIVSRARRRVRADRPRMQVSDGAVTQLLERFAQAVRSRDRDELLALFAEDATWTSDGGGKALAALKVVRGGERICRFVLGVYRRATGRVSFDVVTVNGQPGLATRLGDRLFNVMSMRTDGQRILDVFVVLNPDKLARVPGVPKSPPA